MIIKRVVMCMICLICLGGCAKLHVAHKPEIYLAHQGPLTEYTKININGPFDIYLHTGRTPNIRLKGDSRDTSAVEWHVRNGVLYVQFQKGYPKYGQVRIDLSMYALRELTYHGVGMIQGTQLNTQSLDLLIDNKGKTTLSGNLRVHSLTIQGNGVTVLNGLSGRLACVRLSGNSRAQLSGTMDIIRLEMREHSWLSMHWLDTRALRVRLRDEAFLQLAGVVDKLDVYARDGAHFKARYLRATNAFIKTDDHAVAEISVVRRQHTLASGASQIYFYTLPNMKTDFMAFNGAVLDLREWDQPYLQEPTRYSGY